MMDFEIMTPFFVGSSALVESADRVKRRLSEGTAQRTDSPSRRFVETIGQRNRLRFL